MICAVVDLDEWGYNEIEQLIDDLVASIHFQYQRCEECDKLFVKDEEFWRFCSECLDKLDKEGL